MDSFEKDPRFSHIVSDPRFRPVPKAKRKVKIDKRFNALFTSEHFKTRTDIDKRGRPIKDVTKRSKSVMERFYELSSNSDNSESDDDDNSEVNEESEKSDSDKSPPLKTKKKTTKVKLSKDSLKQPKNKRKLSESESNKPDPDVSKPKAKKAKLSQATKKDDSDGIDSSKSDDDDDASESDASESEPSDLDEDEDSSSDDENLPEYTGNFDLEETGVEHKWNELHNDAIKVSESTRRLAVCNMDWDFVKAQDLFVLLKSFSPEGGRVKSVAIYPSEYGKERMADEALLGPKEMRDMTKANGEANNEASSNVDGDGKKKKKGKKNKNAPLDQKQQKNEDKAVVRDESEKLREYQLNRLRYYYAVVDCDSAATADAIYNECDGKEYQLSSVQLDLRFIPDDMTFEDQPKESFSEDHQQGVADYVPNRFNSTALSQAKVEVTWDETDFDRLSKRVSGLQPKELETMVEENQFAEMIAPPESDSEAENDNPDWLKEALAVESDGSDDDEKDEEESLSEAKKIQLYRKLLMDKLTEEKNAENNDVDQEIQWTPGLKSSAQEKLKKKKKDTEAKGDIVEGYLEKKKQKKKQKMENKKKKEIASAAEKDEELAFSDDDMPAQMDDDLKEMMESEGIDVAKKPKGKKKKKLAEKEDMGEDSETERQKAELELLMMGDGERSISKPKKVVEEGGKMSKKKKKKMAKLAKEKKDKEKEEFSLDMNDDRFSALFTSHHFHIDPNAPQFKKTQNMKKLVDEQISRKKRPKAKPVVNKNVESEEPVVDSKLISKQLVESLKRKMKKT